MVTEVSKEVEHRDLDNGEGGEGDVDGPYGRVFRSSVAVEQVPVADEGDACESHVVLVKASDRVPEHREALEELSSH